MLETEARTEPPPSIPTKKAPTIQIHLEGLYKQLNEVISAVGKAEILKSKILSRSSLWRWNNRINKSLPDCNTVLELLKKHSGLNTIKAIANFYGRDVEKFLRTSFPIQCLKAHSKAINEESQHLEDDYDFYIYFMCGNEKSIERSEIIRTLGTIAAKRANIPEPSITDDLSTAMGQFAGLKIQKLLDLNFLTENDDGLLRRKNTNTYIKACDGLQHSLNLLKDIINPHHWQRGESVFYLTSESVSPDIAKEISEDLRVAYVKAKEKLEKHKSSTPDAIPFLISVAGEKLISEKKRQKKE